MDNLETFLDMFLLSFGLVCLLTGFFTTYFGAGKSRTIGVIILLIGAVIMALLLVFLYVSNDIWEPRSADFWTAFAGTLGAIFSMATTLVVILMVMKFTKGKGEDIATPSPGKEAGGPSFRDRAGTQRTEKQEKPASEEELKETSREGEEQKEEENEEATGEIPETVTAENDGLDQEETAADAKPEDDPEPPLETEKAEEDTEPLETEKTDNESQEKVEAGNAEEKKEEA